MNNYGFHKLIMNEPRRLKNASNKMKIEANDVKCISEIFEDSVVSFINVFSRTAGVR